MNRFGVKLILSIVSFLAVNIWLIGKGVAKGAADFFISATVEETILFIILQLLVVLIYFIYPLTVKKYKIIYWFNKDKNRIEISDVFDARQNPIKIKRQK